MKIYWKYGLFILVLLIILLWLMGFFKSKIKSGEVASTPQKVSGLKIAKVEVRDVSETGYVGRVEAEEEAQISTNLSGTVTSIRVKEGDCFKKGDLLITIEGENIYAQKEALNYQIRGAEAELISAKAHLESIQRTFERYSNLLKERAVTPQEYDEVKAQYESAKASVERAKAQINSLEEQRRAVVSHLKYLNLKAPFSGCVKEKKVNLGDLAFPGNALLVIEKAPYRIKVDLPGKYFNSIKQGAELKVWIEELSQRIPARVIEKSSGINAQTQTFSLKLSLPIISQLKSGMIARVLIPDKRKTILIPESALLQRFDFTGVFVLKPDKTLELRYIKLGEKMEGKVEVLSGLSENEMVVVEGIEKACNGCILE
ncbi:MAG: efflux RND transporter periplasmic adaptor subunit [Caldimicrobium sp.]